MLKLTIVQRVLLGFAALLISIMVLGGTAYNRLGLVSDKLTQSYKELIPLLLATQQVPVKLNGLKDLTNEYLLETDSERLEAIKSSRIQQSDSVGLAVARLERDITVALGSSVIDFRELSDLLEQLAGSSQQLTELADEALLLEESIVLSRTTFFRVWQNLSVDMLRLQENASRSVSRRVRAFDRAGAPVLELFDESINPQDEETFDRAVTNLRNILESMDGYVEQIAEEDERLAQTVGAYRDRLRSALSGPGSLLEMVLALRVINAELEQVNLVYSQQSGMVEQLLTQAVAAVQRYGAAEEGKASALVEGANTLIVGLLIGAIAVVALIAYGLVRSIRSSMADTSEALMQVSAGDFTVSVDTRRNDEFAKIGAVVNTLSETLAHSIAKVAQVAQRLQSSSQESLRMAAETKQDTQEQKLQAESIATAINELESTVAEIANASNEARNLVKTVGDYASDGLQSMNANSATISDLDNQVVSANKVMGELSEHTQKITSVLDVISAIAEQTNLLALNAAIEAARAGESGRGFAVVADEVRSLADKTRQSTVEIKTMIDRLVASSNQVSSIMQKAGSQMQQCVEQTEETQQSIHKITEAVSSVDSMSEQIAEAATQQTEAVQEISRNVVQVAELADRSAGRADAGVHGSELVESLAGEQQQLVAKFTYE